VKWIYLHSWQFRSKINLARIGENAICVDIRESSVIYGVIAHRLAHLPRQTKSGRQLHKSIQYQCIFRPIHISSEAIRLSIKQNTLPTARIILRMKEAVVSKDLTVIIRDVDFPSIPSPDHLIIKVNVSGSNPKDWAIAERCKMATDPFLPII
jgi:hypothetical protein